MEEVFKTFIDNNTDVLHTEQWYYQLYMKTILISLTKIQNWRIPIFTQLPPITENSIQWRHFSKRERERKL